MQKGKAEAASNRSTPFLSVFYIELPHEIKFKNRILLQSELENHWSSKDRKKEHFKNIHKTIFNYII